MTNFLTRDSMNINLAMTGDVECTEYRYQVFSGYRSWVASVFRAYPGPQYSTNWEIRVGIFSEAKDKAIALILAVREEAAQKNKVSSSLTNYEEAALALLALSKKQKAETEELRALLAAKEAENAELQSEKRSALRRANRAEEEVKERDQTLAAKDEEIQVLKTSLRQALCNNVVTKHAASIAGKVAKVATTKVVINIGK